MISMVRFRFWLLLAPCIARRSRVDEKQRAIDKGFVLMQAMVLLRGALFKRTSRISGQ